MGENLGNYYRDGYLYTREEIQTWDHDFKSVSEGTVIPHGLYDIVKNKGHITIGTSKDTSEFATESIKLWWDKYGKYDYPNGPWSSFRQELPKKALDHILTS